MNIKGLFRGITKDYDRMNAIMSLGLHNRWRASCVKMAQFPNGSKILDLGCGTGDFSLQAKKYVKGAKVFGIDLLEDMLIIAKKKANITPIVADTISLPFRANSFEGILLGFVLRHIDLQAFLKEAMRVLKAKGRLIILELSFPKHWLSRFFFKLYLYHIVPFLGGIFSTKSAYAYLGESLKHLPKTSEIETLAYQEGAKEVVTKKFMFGSLFCLLVIK